VLSSALDVGQSSSSIASSTSDVAISSTTDSGSGGSSSAQVVSSSAQVGTTTSGPVGTDSTTTVESSTATSISISFPSGNSSVAVVSSTAVAASSTSSNVAISVNSDFSFVLAESSLVLNSVSVASMTLTLSDPDAVTTTLSSAAPGASVTTAPLPSDLPSIIYAQSGPGKQSSGQTLVSILFDQYLGWAWVVQNSTAGDQIFAYTPVLVATAIDVPADQVVTYELHVAIPANYQGPQDAADLGTVWMGFINSSLVDTLADQIKDRSSAFYTGTNNAVAQQLAQHVESGFDVTSYPNPNANTDSSNADNATGATSQEGKTREDAIIGVVSALGAIALVVLGFLVFRAMKRRRELRHHRLSDPPNVQSAGIPPTGRDFDQDSVGGQRRRSFYFAEDSLRGFDSQYGGGSVRQDDEMYEHNRTSPAAMTRRNVVPNAISAPILTGSSMNW